jgi:PIN domain nuclease of toxin-antitoxin system
MTYLIDTHVILWAALEPEKLSPRAADILGSQDHLLAISSASVWEIVVKVSIGKLELPMELDAFIHTTVSRLSAQSLSIKMDDALELGRLPLHHKDPFDRILIAQARTHRIPIISVDRKIALYDVTTIS